MTLLTLDEAAAEFKVHRTTLYRALRDGRLHRHRRSGSRHTWLDREEVREVLLPARLTEADLVADATEVIQNLTEDFVEALEGSPPDVQPWISTLRDCLARFLDHYDLTPGLDFGTRTQVAVMYGKGPGYVDRPTLAIHGIAEHVEDGASWTFTLSIDLVDELNAVLPGEGSVRGIASADKYESEPLWILAVRRVRVRDPDGGPDWVPATAVALNRVTGEIEALMGNRILRPPGDTSPKSERRRLQPSDYVIEDEPFPGTVVRG